MKLLEKRKRLICVENAGKKFLNNANKNMAIKIKLYGTKQGTEIIRTDEQKKQYQIHLDKFKDGTDIEETISRKYRQRTQGAPGEESNQNGYWWGVIVKYVADEMGELDMDYVHQTILIQIGHFSVDKFGEKRVRETKDLSKGEFEDLCRKARMWASVPGNLCELGCYIPEPYEVDYQQ